MRDEGTGDWTTARALRAALAFVAGLGLILASPHLPSWAGDLLHELGFALVVAVVIWLTFHTLSRREDEERWRRRIERVRSDVVSGVLRRDLPKGLLLEVNRLALDQAFILRNLTLEYVLADDSYANPGGASVPCVTVSAALRFTVVNISDAPRSFPIAVTLSNPFEPGLKEKCDVPSARLHQHGAWRDVDIAGGRARFRLALARSAAAQVRCHCGDVQLISGEEAELDIRYVMAKREEDADTFETLYPSDSLRLMVVDHGAQGRRIGAIAHHPGALEDQTLTADGGPYQYRLDRYLLPHQGATIWWRKPDPARPPPGAA